MSLGEKQLRRTVYYEGRVQGVGFRYTTNTLAQSFPVTGRVMNLHDGRVQLIAEGESQEIARFLTQVSETLGRYIRNMQVVDSPATGQFENFAIETGS